MWNKLREAMNLREAAKLIATTRGAPPSNVTMRTWATTGYRPRAWKGEPIVLRTVRLGVDLVTCKAWVEEFDLARWELGEQIRKAEAQARQEQQSKYRPRRSRLASQRRAARYLDEAGCK